MDLKKKKTIQGRLNLFIMCLILCIVVTGCLVAINIFFSIYENDMKTQVNTGIYHLEKMVIDDKKDAISGISENIIKIWKYNPSDITLNELNVLTNFIGKNNIEYLQIADNNGVYYEKSIANDETVKQAFNRKLEQNQESQVWIDGSSVSGLHLFRQERFTVENSNLSLVMTLVLPLGDQEIVDYVKATSSLEATIFAGDVREATTIMQNEASLVGTSLDPEIAAVLFDEEKEYFGKTDIFGEPFLVGYIPIGNEGEKPVGALFVGRSMASMFDIRNQIIASITILGAILLLGFYLVSQKWLERNISAPIWRIVDAMKIVSQGNYEVVSKLPEARNQEIEILQNSMQTMVEKIFKSQEQLRITAYYDSTTGLANRALFYQKYQPENALKTNDEESDNELSVLYYLDVDNLKYINNLFGHQVGDSLLYQIGKALREITKDNLNYMVYRISGDEFVICKENGIDPNEIISFSEQIIKIFQEPFSINGQSLNVTVSIGISYNNPREINEKKVFVNNLEMMLIKAELAMNQVKMQGKNNYMVFDPKMNDKMERKATLEQDLKNALRNSEFELYYQPKFNLELNRFDGFEALIRWKHPIWGFISPLEFIQIAEESNLILDLGFWILQKSCSFIKSFNKKNKTSYCVAVNVSAIQLLDDRFEDMIEEVLRLSGTNPKHLELEITESVLMNSMDLANKKLLFLREKNISVALDDFGTGYSSLTYLKTLPITTVKLDKSFVDDIVENETSYQIVNNVVQIANNLGLKIVVEGVETKEQLDLLKQLKCQVIQGYYFSRPVPESQLKSVLDKWQ